MHSWCKHYVPFPPLPRPTMPGLDLLRNQTGAFYQQEMPGESQPTVPARFFQATLREKTHPSGELERTVELLTLFESGLILPTISNRNCNHIWVWTQTEFENRWMESNIIFAQRWNFPEILGSAVWVGTWPTALGISVLDVFLTQKPTKEGKEEENTLNARTEGESKPALQYTLSNSSTS